MCVLYSHFGDGFFANRRCIVLDWAAIRPVDGTFPNHVADSQRQGALITEASATPGPDMRNTL